MHILAEHYRSEFLATPELIRFDHANGDSGREPTLLIKTTTRLLKYITLGVRMRLVLAGIRDRVFYGLEIYEEPDSPHVLWSIVERPVELASIRDLLMKQECQVFLFNELALNVAHHAVPIVLPDSALRLLEECTTGEIVYDDYADHAADLIDRLGGDGNLHAGILVAEVPPRDDWRVVTNLYITNQGNRSTVMLQSPDEGGQQEALVVWLTDSLQPMGAYHNPQVMKQDGPRELTDILLTYLGGSVLIESKTLAILGRAMLPGRERLGRDTAGHIEKAVRQLRGGIRSLRNNLPVLTQAGTQIDVEREHPAHALVLLPDLELIDDEGAYGNAMLKEFAKATGGFLHFLDLSELLRLVQASQQVAATIQGISAMQAFDHFLLERVKKAHEVGTLRIKILHVFGGDSQ